MPDPAKPVSRLLNKSFGVETFKFNRWSVELDEYQTIKDVMVPSFLAEQASAIMGQDPANPRGIGDIIVVRKPDTAEYWELIVRDIGKGFVRTQLKAECRPAAVVIDEDDPLTIKWNVGKRKFDVIRKEDKRTMKPDFNTREAAALWIAQNRKDMAA